MTGQLGIEVGFDKKTRKSEEHDITVGFDGDKPSKKKTVDGINVGFSSEKRKNKPKTSKLRILEAQNKYLMRRLQEAQSKVDILTDELV